MKRINFKLSVKSFVYIQLLIVLYMEILISIFGLPRTIRYACDLITFGTFFITIFKCPKLNSRVPIMTVYLIPFCIAILFSLILNGGQIFFILWGFRNVFRFFIFFFVCIFWLDNQDFKKIFNIFFFSQIINFLVTLIQFFLFGLKQDFLGGIFGTAAGANGYSNLFMCIVFSITLISLISNEISIRYSIFLLVSCMVIASLAEIKFFYIEIIIIFLLSVILSKPNIKNIIIFILTILFFVIGINIFDNIFPGTIAFYLDKQAISDYLSVTWANGLEVGRSTAVSIINEFVFFNKKIYEIFGRGFGNFEFSNFKMTTLYQRYSSMNYGAFTFSMIYIELGWFGLISYLSFWLIQIKKFLKVLLSSQSFKNKYLSKIGILIITVILLNIWYNNSMRAEPGYLAVIALATCWKGINRGENAENDT